jgi:hypothetical protein
VNVRPEQQIHRAVVQHLRQRGVPGLVLLHPANGGARKPVEAAIFKSLGVRPGAADLLLWHDGKSFALELRAEGCRPTVAQLEFLDDMKNAGAFTCLCEGFDRALKVLEVWGLLRERAS